MSSDFFKFEKKDLDFPFYNGKPSVSLIGWLLLLIGLILRIAFAFGLWNYIPGAYEWPIPVTSLIAVFIMLIPLAFCCGGNLGLIIKKPKLKDFKVIILCVVAYFIFTIAVGLLLRMFGIIGVANPIAEASVAAPLLVLIELIVALFGEELIKIIIFLIVMSLCYYFTKNRKNSMIVAIIITCISFGLIHLPTYEFNFIQCILLIGGGCLIHLYPYLKTKNIVNSYITHILIDFVIVVPIMIMGTSF